jgi:hypothetical protein
VDPTQISDTQEKVLAELVLVYLDKHTITEPSEKYVLRLLAVAAKSDGGSWKFAANNLMSNMSSRARDKSPTRWHALQATAWATADPTSFSRLNPLRRVLLGYTTEFTSDLFVLQCAHQRPAHAHPSHRISTDGLTPLTRDEAYTELVRRVHAPLPIVYDAVTDCRLHLFFEAFTDEALVVARRLSASLTTHTTSDDDRVRSAQVAYTLLEHAEGLFSDVDLYVSLLLIGLEHPSIGLVQANGPNGGVVATGVRRSLSNLLMYYGDPIPPTSSVAKLWTTIEESGHPCSDLLLAEISQLSPLPLNAWCQEWSAVSAPRRFGDATLRQRDRESLLALLDDQPHQRELTEVLFDDWSGSWESLCDTVRALEHTAQLA